MATTKTSAAAPQPASGDEVGGTWRDNSSSGAACDVPSSLSSLSLAPNPAWSRSFAAHPEIQDDLRRVADTSGVRRHLHLRCTVTGVAWLEREQRWGVEADRGGVQARMRETGWTNGGCLAASGRDTTQWPEVSFRFAARLRGLDPADDVLDGSSTRPPRAPSTPHAVDGTTPASSQVPA